MLYRLKAVRIAFCATAALLTACTTKSDAPDTTQAASGDIASEETAPTNPSAAPAPAPETSLVGIDQMPATARFSVSGPKPDDGWNGSWNIKSNRLGCGINTYPKMINFDIADEDNTRGDFADLRMGTNDGPDVGGSTSKFSISLSLDRPGANLSISPQNHAGDTGTLTIIENANGHSRFTVKARSARGVQFEGEFTCVPR